MSLLKSNEYGYHKSIIKKGVFGDSSKIREELNEFEDAIQQGSSIMALIELCDLYGAIEGYLNKHYPNMTMDDVRTFSTITKRVFENGHRK